MAGIRLERYAEPSSFLLGLSELRRRGVTPRGLLFLCIEPSGAIHVGVPDAEADVSRLKVGDKLGLEWPLPGRYFHFDSVHRLRAGQFVWNGDRRLRDPGDADDVAGAVTVLLKLAGSRSVFFGCTPHLPGSFLCTAKGSVALHDEGVVDALPFDEHRVLARRILDPRLWLLTVEGNAVVARDPVFESDLGNVLVLERRLSALCLVLNCERGIIEVDLSELPTVRERERVASDGTIAVVGRLAGRAFAVTHGTQQPWGLDDIAPAVLIGAEDGSLRALGDQLAQMRR